MQSLLDAIIAFFAALPIIDKWVAAYQKQSKVDALNVEVDRTADEVKAEPDPRPKDGFWEKS